MRSSQPIRTALRGSNRTEGFESRAFEEFRWKIKRGNESPNSLVTQRNTKFFLTLQNNEHFHRFPAPSLSLSGSAGVLLFACYSGSTGTLTRVPPHHGLRNEDKEECQVIMIGIHVLLCLRLAVIPTLIWLLLYFSFGFELREKMLLWAKRFSQQNTPSKCCSWVT